MTQTPNLSLAKGGQEPQTLLNIAVFLGGISPERNVSLASGRSVVNALRELGHNVTAIDPTFGNEQPNNFLESLPQNIAEIPPSLSELSNFPTRNYFACVNSSLLDNVEIVFLALHGKYGEDGIMQSLLELRGIPYTGSNILASSLAMDKAMAKVVFERNGIATPKWKVIEKQEMEKWRSGVMEFPIPCVVKPNDGGSTIGMSIVTEKEKLIPAIELAFQYSEKVLLEEFIEGRELTVPIVGNEALPIIEIKPKGGFYDYTRKYTKGETEYICPAELPKESFLKIQEQGLKAFNVLGCKGFARTDFRLKPNGELYCLEVNTIPGMTSTSLVPKAAKVVGIEFPQLCERIVRLAMELIR
ncbi:MAG: D-alanine--D-alanine ligase [Ignavibacteriales bacterium]|nr:D-alanine--D-alanine ligase [Ignavibacteriales bacterium]